MGVFFDFIWSHILVTEEKPNFMFLEQIVVNPVVDIHNESRSPLLILERIIPLNVSSYGNIMLLVAEVYFEAPLFMGNTSFCSCVIDVIALFSIWFSFCNVFLNECILSSQFFMNKKRSHEVSPPMAPFLCYCIASGGLGDRSISVDSDTFVNPHLQQTR